MKQICALIGICLLISVSLSLNAAEIPLNLPKINMEAYLFTRSEIELKNMERLALLPQGRDVDELKISFERHGFIMMLMPVSVINRAIETGVADGIVCTSKELIIELKKKYPDGLAFSLYPEIALFDQKLQISETYQKFGLSFRCPKDQKITERSHPLYGDKPTNKIGGIWIKSDPKTDPVILVSWLPGKKADYEEIAKLMGVAIKARKQNHEIHLEKKMRELKLRNHRLLVQRYCTQGKEGILLNVVAGWICDHSSRVYQITVAAPWKKPTFVYSSDGPALDWPSVENDPSFIALHELIKSFNCHDGI